jgi:hypothetical protein
MGPPTTCQVRQLRVRYCSCSNTTKETSESPKLKNERIDADRHTAGLHFSGYFGMRKIRCKCFFDDRPLAWLTYADWSSTESRRSHSI